MGNNCLHVQLNIQRKESFWTERQLNVGFSLSRYSNKEQRQKTQYSLNSDPHLIISIQPNTIQPSESLSRHQEVKKFHVRRLKAKFALNVLFS